MKIWVDADSCPASIRNIIIKAARRLEIPAEFVANRPIPVPDHPLLFMNIVEARDQEADLYIVRESTQDDLVVTRDIPLAADLVGKGVLVLNDRGNVYTADNVRPRLSMRDFMSEMRQAGIYAEQNNRFGPKEIQLFANAFDRELRKKIQNGNKTNE